MGSSIVKWKRKYEVIYLCFSFSRLITFQCFFILTWWVFIPKKRGENGGKWGKRKTKFTWLVLVGITDLEILVTNW